MLLLLLLLLIMMMMMMAVKEVYHSDCCERLSLTKLCCSILVRCEHLLNPQTFINLRINKY
jgi:hypothetical protein